MKAHNEKQLLSGVAAVGRINEIERLYLHAVSGAGTSRIRVSGPPEGGTSELLRKVYDRLFQEQRFVVPFYFSLRPGHMSGRTAATQYLYQFLLQAIAFRRNDPDLIGASPDICQLKKLAPMSDAAWVEQLCEACENEGPLNDDRAMIRSTLAAPFRASAAGRFRVCVIVDNLHDSSRLEDGRVLVDELSSLSVNLPSLLMIGARRRFELPERNFGTITVKALDREECAILIELLAGELGIAIGEQARDLIAVKFDGRLEMIKSFMFAARDVGSPLDSYRDVEMLYVDLLFNGKIGSRFDDIFSIAAPDPLIRKKLLDVLSTSMEPGMDRFPVEVLNVRLGSSVDEINVLTERLELDEILTIENGTARLSSDTVLHDYIGSRRTTAGNNSTDASKAVFAVTNALKRAPQLMARIYRREASIDLRAILSGFDIRVIPRPLIDYRAFRDRYKGISDEQLRTQLAAEVDSVILPQIVHASPIVEHFPEFGIPVEPERAIAGVGFTDRTYRDEDEIVWLAVEIDSKLEADRSITLEWCDRLDAAASACGYSNYKLWLIAPEGFSDGALDLLSERNGFGSSKRQVEGLLKFLLDEETALPADTAEYEIVIPMGDETELIAAHTLEEIVRRYSFPAKAVNQIKTALVEACINAAEHSLSPDKKIHQKFTVDPEKIVITVSNRGLRLIDKINAGTALGESNNDGRRGWGLELIRNLMDDVRLESVDDGTRIVMTKYLRG